MPLFRALTDEDAGFGQAEAGIGGTKKFGIFYPRGYVIVALRSQEDAERMRWSLIEGGYDDEDIKLLDTEKVLEIATEELENLNPLVRAVGAESSATERAFWLRTRRRNWIPNA